MAEVACATCVYWAKQQHGDAGECRIAPPMPVLYGQMVTAGLGGADGEVLAVWPVTNAEDWCGAHEVEQDEADETLARLGILS